MAKVLKKMEFNDETGKVDIEYDDNTNRSFNLADTVTASTTSSGVLGFSLNVSAGVTVAAYGDSFTQYNLLCGQQVSNVLPTGLGRTVQVYSVELGTPAGAGALVYNAARKTLTWTPAGFATGPEVDASRTGFFKVPASQDNAGIWLIWFGSEELYTSGTAAVTVLGTGFEVWRQRANGLAAAAIAHSGQRLRWAKWSGHPSGCGNLGIGGGTLKNIRSMIEWQGADLHSDVAIVSSGGRNSITSSVPLTDMIADATATVEVLKNRARFVIYTTIPPRDTDTAEQRRTRAAFNSWLVQYSRSTGYLKVFDLAAIVTDPTNGNFYSAYSATGDKVHLSDYGAQVAGKALAAFIGGLIPLGAAPLKPTYDDIYDATYNPTGPRYGAGVGVFAGTGGTAGAGISGVIPASVSVARIGSAITAVGSKIPKTDAPGEDWQLAISGATAVEYITATVTLTPTPTAGTVLEASAEFEVISSSGLANVDLQITENGKTPSSNAYVATNDGLPDGMGRVTIKTIPWAVPPGGALVSMALRIKMLAGSTATIRFVGWRIDEVTA